MAALGGHYSSSLRRDQVIDDRLHPGPEAERFTVFSFHSLDKLMGEKIQCPLKRLAHLTLHCFFVHLSV